MTAAASGAGELTAVEALAAGSAWKEALDRGRALMRAGAEPVLVLLALARGALASGRPDRAAKALDQAGADDDVRVAELRVQVLERQSSREAAIAWLAERSGARPHDAALAALLGRLTAVPEDVVGTLPLESLARVERLLAEGFPSRALRLARRLRLAHPDDDRVADVTVRAAAAASLLDPQALDVLAGLALPELDEALVEIEPLDMGPA